MKPKILVVEDDLNIQHALKRAMEVEGFEVTQAMNGDLAEEQFLGNSFDLVILDLMLPNKSGFDVLKFIRSTDDKIPVLILSAKAEEHDKVKGFKYGADDYIQKPFSIKELIARINRKIARFSSVSVMCFGNNVYNFVGSTLTQNNIVCVLTAKEILLLEYFLKNPRQIISREQIINRVWGMDYEGTDRTIDNFVMGLRKKIGKDHIETIRNMGYRFLTQP